MTDLTELAKRVEAGEAGLPIHKEILAALGYTWRGMGYWCHDDSHQWKGLTGFTTSVDAAMELVPKDWNATVRGCNDSWHVVLNSTKRGPLLQSFAFSRTPSLALTASALRARAAMGEG